METSKQEAADIAVSSVRSSTSRTWANYLGLVARGFLIGTVDCVPGVSGGTMALILGIYEELIDSIRSVLNPAGIKLLLRLKVKQFFASLPWQFLLAVGSGILLAVLTVAYLLEWVLAKYPALLWAFFFGLVAASVVMVSRRIKRWGPLPIVSIVAGAVVSYTLVGLVPMETPNTWWFLFLSGVLAICAMVLPGVSGAFVLVLLGKYQYLLSAVTNRDVLTLLIVICGAGVGLVTFAQVVGWFFKRYHDLTVAVLTGLMLGSLRKIWPWKETAALLTAAGETLREINVLPAQLNVEVGLAVVLALIGFGLVFLVDYQLARKASKKAA